MPSSPRSFLIAGRRVEPSLNRITVAGEVHRLEPKVMAVLCELARSPGELVERSRLIEAAWPQAFVTDSVLGRAIHLLRRVLGDDARRPRVIETIPRRGFRLLAAVEPAPEAGSSNRPAGAGEEGSRRLPIMGRDGERRRLGELLERARQDRGSLLMLGGEAGIGKTRLVDDLVERAAGLGMAAFVGHCYEMEGAPPFSPWVEILEQMERIVPSETLLELLGDGAPEIARMLPELRRRFPDLPAPLELPAADRRQYLFRCFRGFLVGASRARPMLLVLEDLHWAEEATLLLLEHVAAHVDSLPLVIVGSYRDVELTAGAPLLGKTFAELLRARRMERLDLQRLPQDSVAAMLESLSGKEPPPGPVDTFYRETDGNPFFVEEVYQHFEAGGRLFEENGEWRDALETGESDVPVGVRLTLRRRLEGLTSDERSVLTAAAVIGRSCNLDLLRRVSGADMEALLRVLERAEQLALTQSTDRPSSSGRRADFAFRHELVRQTLLAEVPQARRCRLHLAAASALEETSRDLSREASALAHHLYQAGGAADSDKTVRFLAMAGDEALRAGAFEEAQRRFDQALERAPGNQPIVRAELLWRRGLSRRSLGRFDGAADDWKEALSLAETAGDRDWTARLRRELGSAL